VLEGCASLPALTGARKREGGLTGKRLDIRTKKEHRLGMSPALIPDLPVDAPSPTVATRPDVTVSVRAGATRVMLQCGFTPVWEFTLANNRRADICALGPKGQLAIVEVKSSLEDFRVDLKWPEYEPYCDHFYFAVSPDFPMQVLPEGPGLIVGDAFGGEIVRAAPRFDLAPARRKAVTLSFARHAAMRALRL
jgi:hypothetical protein